MSPLRYPHSNIFVGSTWTIDTVGPHIHVINSQTGERTFSTTKFSENDKDDVFKSGPVRCSAVDRSAEYLITVGEDKRLKLWELEGLKLVNSRELPKRPTALAFTADSQTIIVSDKFGDVFTYPFLYDSPPPPSPSSKGKGKEKERDTISSHENPSGGALVLGHTSPLNCFLLTHNEKFIITADRDEHIRVNRFPKGYIIEMYCLGHLKFVSAIHIPASSPSTLISGGGDPVLKIWDWMSGKCQHELRIWETVDPFIAVKGVIRRRGWWDGENGEAGGVEDDADEDMEGGDEKKSAKGKKGRRAKYRKGSGKDQDNQEDLEGSIQPLAYQKVLVVSRIESLQSGSENWVIFSAIGSTAIFAFPLKSAVSVDDIRHFDFHRPVVTFTVVENEIILISLDVDHRSPEQMDEAPSGSDMAIRIVKLLSGQISEISDFKNPLVDALNSDALVEATPAEIKKLDLYGDLTSMPKFSADPEPSTSSSSTLIPTSAAFSGDPTATPPAVPIGAPELSRSSAANHKGRRKPQGVKDGELSKREAGRLKVKEAVQKKAREQAEAGSGGATDGNGEVPEPLPKKLKPENDLQPRDGDAVMADG